MDGKTEAAEMDARALLNLANSLRDGLRAAKPMPPARILEAVETAHAEILRASHLVTTWTATIRNSEREPRPSFFGGRK